MPIDGRRVGQRSGRGIRYAALAACAPLLVAVLTACGPGQSETTGEANSGTAGQWDAYDKQKQNLATCLNEKGLSVRYLGHDNMVDFSGLPEGELTPELVECFQKWPALDPPVKDTPRKPTEEELRERREIAACMRNNGVPDYPDPDPDPAPIDGATAKRMKDELRARMANPTYKAATEICMPRATDGPGVG
ncbi:MULTISPECIES: hypothetical protein [unclassified Micromonospora]|uniref:hypothetical protein n=1 Tax=unclassified Micromonospora TaxID=2617518 RepID=UPI0033A6920B